MIDQINLQRQSLSRLDPNRGHPFSTGLLVMQPTTFCNINCRYCYLPDRVSKRRMSLDTVAATIANLRESDLLAKQLTVVWHAGEPLAVPIEFYEQAFPLVRAHGIADLRLSQAVQTNLTLLTDAHCNLFRRNDIHIGVSLDGPEFLHDSQRVTRSGKGTFATVMAGVERLKAAELSFNVICVLTRRSLDYANEMFDFFMGLGAKEIAFNIDEQEGTNATSSFGCPEVAVAYQSFMRTFFHRMRAAERPMIVREFRQLDYLIKNGRTLDRNNQVDPFAIISVDTAGNFSTFSPELLGLQSFTYGGFVLGNVHTGRIIDSMETERFRRIAGDVAAGVARCKAECTYFNICGGGAPSNKYYENHSFQTAETMYCRVTKKALTDVYLDCLEEGLGISPVGVASGG